MSQLGNKLCVFLTCSMAFFLQVADLFVKLIVIFDGSVCSCIGRVLLLSIMIAAFFHFTQLHLGSFQVRSQLLDLFFMSFVILELMYGLLKFFNSC